MIQQKLRIQKREYGGHKRRKLNQHRLDCKYCNKKKIKGQYKPNKHSFEN
jgi:5-methylcytosine-specific restriction endonuclease McrA